MIEKVHQYSTTDDKKVEKLIMDENINYIHMVFGQGEGLPEHYSNSNVYMNVIRGDLTIRLDEQEAHDYPKGSLLEIPYNIKMNVGNSHQETLELVVVKAPAPKHYKE
ncbi:cupin domain-containing protein [Eubacteriaceae bacterium ES2]|nr:cupin domain-containing protein [Eubacteriaceae bacterium ES2]WKY46332.1 cupin domain-containing protein [Eubacteriaceae bacterium ES3]